MPIPHVQDGELITSEVFNALIDAVNALELRVASPLEIKKMPGGGQVISLGYGFDLSCVCELTEDLASAGSAEAKILWDENQAGTWATDADTEHITVYAPTDMSGVTGDRVLAKYDRQSGLWLAYQKDC